MFLHAGAGLHGHEYSVRTSNSDHAPTLHKSTLLRTALRPLAAESGTPSRSAPRHAYRLSVALDDLSSSSSHQLPPSDAVQRKELAVRFREPRTDQSEDEASVAGTEVGTDTASERGSVRSTSLRRPRRQRAPRKSTRYALALPPSQLRHKQRRLVQIRPRLLLQLQEVGDRRAMPSFDVVPSCPLAGNIFSPLLARRFPRIFRARPQLSQDQVLVVRSDHTGPPSVSGINDRDVLAVITAAAAAAADDRCAAISLDDGSTWEASPKANGSFEFTTVDDQDRVITARWVRRCSPPTNKRGSSSTGGSTSPPPGLRWTFSLIDPSTRRHPVMGSLTPDAVDVYDSFHTLSASSRLYPPSRAFPDDGTTGERTTVMVTQGQKNLMLATATWISLHWQGWPALPNSRMSFLGGGSGFSGRRRTFDGFDGDGGGGGDCIEGHQVASRKTWPSSFQSPPSWASSMKRHSTGQDGLPQSKPNNFLPRRGSHSKQQQQQQQQPRKSKTGMLTTTTTTTTTTLCRSRIWPWLQRLRDRGRGRERRTHEQQTLEKVAPGGLVHT
ncbi:hypothetical protein CP532_4016 [Ophiocordyceps camponoti-leonardi (nom. inval.)]|nr:hypothetical protein CP532_4016 [Ophiocordyceps camponoti-leonardi (nom. inval.)]